MPPAPDGFGWTSLIRHGGRPLGFFGRVLFEVSARDPALPVWSDVALHETQGAAGEAPALVVAIHHRLRGADPLHRHYAQACDGIEAALDFLHAHEPLRDLPAEALYAGAGPAMGMARHEAARDCAARLRQGWRATLETCFGHHHPSGEPA